jgi:murein DD-endopeptidase MepM/ murein hydrolase activator NlpD
VVGSIRRASAERIALTAASAVLVMLGCLLLASVAAASSTGGTGIPPRAKITRFACRTGCVAVASTRSRSASPSAQIGSKLRLRGANLSYVARVVFGGGAKGRPVAKSTRWLDVVVPARARSGRLRVYARGGPRSRPSETPLIITAAPRPTPRPPASSAPTSSGSYGRPLSRGWIVTSKFWEARSYESHPGVDLAISRGTTIKAIGAGRVTTAGYSGGYGNYTCIRHTARVSSCYAHQTEILVQVGDTVSRGEKIGTVGCTGSCTGPHLHFEIRVNGWLVCPAPWVGADSDDWCESNAPGFGTTSVSARARARSAAVYGRDNGTASTVSLSAAALD